ncbi:NCK5L protein, partial [Haliaeetus albicilla]|nr:NCK5L protein [Haliaeetus albicilla]
QAENSALAQANENQRETYERCLDEVANHVVQALLNQKDLREECIKLKKRVFDLERQNQALSDLFQQKLQLSAGSLPQVRLWLRQCWGGGGRRAEPPQKLNEASSSSPAAAAPSAGAPGCPSQPPARHCRAAAPPTAPHPLHPPARGDPSAAPLEALSPFFKKKAQILEVLRKLEETDPLLGPPLASPGSPEPCAAPGWPSCPLRGPRAAGGWRGAEGSPCSSPEEAAPPRGALLSALAERLLRGEGGCCRRNGEAPGGPPRQRCGEHPAFLGLYAPGEESPEGGFTLLSPGGGPNPLPSPPKVLKLPPPAGALRLSPQLARASKIPCRGGNPEASPAFSRRASPDAPPEPGSPEPPAFPPPLAYEAAEQPPGPPGPPASGERVAASPPSTRRGTGGSAPSRRPGKKPPEPGYLPFKERLAALGKLRGAEGREPPGPGRPERGHGAEPRPPPRGSLGGSLKHPEPAHGGEPLARCYSSGSMGEPGKAGGKGRPASGRTPPRAPPAPPAKAARSPHGSPTKLPTKAGAGKTGTPRGEEPVGAKAAGVPHKTPPAPEPPGTGPPPGAAGHSAIEEKVMKGIEENVLRLQGQERAPAGEAKGKAAGGLASWFGLRRSKLPALSRRGDGSRGREWAGTPAPLRREVKLAARKLEAESLNISKLMEKAEDLRKALREEHAFLQGLALEKGRPRGPPRGPGHLPVMYQEVTAETFMQQLLDRVDGKDVPYESRLERKRELCDLRRAPPDTKDPRLCRLPRNGIVGHLQEPPDKGGTGVDRPPPAPALMPPLAPAACGSLTRTLDSGIGTFPPPDYGGVPAKSTPKPRGRPEPLPGAVPARPPAITKVPRKARTLEREVTSAEELLVAGKHRSAPVCRPPAPPGPQGHRAGPQDAGDDAGKPRHVQQSKNWTFPNAKACGTADPFLCPPGGLEGLHRPALVRGGGGHRGGASPEAPPPLPPALSASSSRTPSASDVGDEGSTEAQSRDGGHGPPGLEHSESLSDSLYDSLSSCGSQG